MSEATQEGPQKKGFTGPQFRNPTADPGTPAGPVQQIEIEYERNLPRTVEEAMQEFMKRVQFIGSKTGGQVDIAIVIFHLLQDFEKGIKGESQIILPSAAEANLIKTRF